MNEPFDVELSRALKDGAAKSLEGWQFTPAMRAKVLERVRTEPAEEAPAAPPTKRVDPIRLIRPVAWVAAAAAAFLIMANLGGIAGLSPSRKDMKTTSAPALEAAKPQAPATAAPGDTAFTTSRPQDQVPAASAPNRTDSAPTGQGTGIASAAAAPTVTVVTLTVPGKPDGRGPETSAAGPDSTPRPLSLKAAAVAENLSLASGSNGPILSLTSTGLKAQAADGAILWERPLAELNWQSRLAEAPDGRAAVANGANLLYLVGNGGELERTVTGAAPIERLLWSGDGRVAAAEGTNVVVYAAATGTPTFTVDAGLNGQMAFAPDGLLAVLGDRPNDPNRLLLLDQKGTATAEIRPAPAGRGLAFAAGGTVVVAGGQAYDRVGKPLWQMPLVTEGIVAGEAQVIGWDAHTILAVDAHDGHALWKADWQGEGPGVQKVVLAPDGRHVMVVAPLADGAAFWMMDNAGKVLCSDRLPQMPVDVSFAGNQAVLLLPQSLVYKAVQ